MARQKGQLNESIEEDIGLKVTGEKKESKWFKINSNKTMRDKYNKKAKKWTEENRDKYLLIRRRYEKKNKIKTHSRTNTWRLLNNSHALERYGLNLIKTCKSCGTEKNVQTHHEIYPTKTINIVKAIKEGKIFFVCKECHSNLHHI